MARLRRPAHFDTKDVAAAVRIAAVGRCVDADTDHAGHIAAEYGLDADDVATMIDDAAARSRAVVAPSGGRC